MYIYTYIILSDKVRVLYRCILTRLHIMYLIVTAVSGRIFHFSPLIHIRRRPWYWPPLCPSRMTHRPNNGVRWRDSVCIYALHHGRLAKRVVVARVGVGHIYRPPSSIASGQTESEIARPKHTHIHTQLTVGMNEWSPPLPPPSSSY